VTRTSFGPIRRLSSPSGASGSDTSEYGEDEANTVLIEPRSKNDNPRRMRIVPLVAAASAGLALPGSGVASTSQGNPVAGKRVWQTAQPPCAYCHTLQAGSAYGSTGPNLDEVKPSLATIIKFVTHGSVPNARYPTSMQTYGGVLTKKQIEDVAAFIFRATHK
jgi:mono/diheme cytochrome c family protein